MEEFRNQLVALINANQLPFEAKFYVLKDVYRDVWDAYQASLKNKNAESANNEEGEKK